jgi:hypothetical protein
MVTNMCSTSLPGRNQVDGLLPVSNTAVRDIRFKMGTIFFAWKDSFALDLKMMPFFEL